MQTEPSNVAARTRCAAALIATTLAALPAAQAQHFASSAIARNGSTQASQSVPTGRSATEASGSAFDGSQTRWSYVAGAFADLNRGAVGADVVADKTGPSFFFPLNVHTWSTVLDQLTFHGAAPAEIEFSATITGSFSAMAYGGRFSASSDLFFGTTNSHARFSYQHDPLAPEREALVSTSGEVTHINRDIESMAATLHVRQLVVPGQTLHLQMDFELEASPGNNDRIVANFGHTVQLSFVMPPGYSFTSDSGTFMTEAPTTPIPEPGTAALCLAGAALLLARRVRR